MVVAKKITVPFANTGDKVEIPLGIQANGSVSREKGFTDHYELEYDNPNAKDIERTVFNQIEFEQDSAISEIQQYGVAIFSNEDGYSYPKGAQVFHDGQMYFSLIDENANTPPHSSWFTIEGLFDSLPISSGYSSLKQYKSGDIVRVNGIYYECYHPNGCKGIDPTNPINRPSEWASADVHAPYYWVEIGKYLMLPEIGSPIPIATMQIREGLIKYRNDAQLSATKFWRIAEQNPNLVKDGFIEIADLRANVIRGLDDEKGSDPNRLINSFQYDAQQNIKFGSPVGQDKGWLGNGNVNTGDQSFGLKIIGQGNSVNLASGANQKSNWFFWDYDLSRTNRTAEETRMKNIAMYYCCRI